MHGVWEQRQRQRVGLNDARLVGRPTVPCLSSSHDRGEVWCRLGGPCRSPVTIGGDTRCHSGVVPLQSSPTPPTSLTSAPTAAARSRTWHSCNRTQHGSSHARHVALSTRSGAQDTLPVRSSWSAFSGRRHRPPPLTIPCEVLEPLASKAMWRQLIGCHPVRGGETVEALPE
jgi:hypothetical protein